MAAGAIYWALEEFRVRPGWDGGNPRPDPPIHQKGLLRFAGRKKPAWFDVNRWYTQTQQIGRPCRPAVARAATLSAAHGDQSGHTNSR